MPSADQFSPVEDEPDDAGGPPPAAIEEDGYLIDPDSGEVLGLAWGDPDKPLFDRGSDVSDADFVLSLRMKEECALRAIAEQQAALMDNLRRMAKAHERRLEHLGRFYGPNLERTAREALAGKKTRTLALPHGTLALRKKPGKCSVPRERMAEAVAWAEDNMPELIRTKVDSWVPAREALDAYHEWADAKARAGVPISPDPVWAEVVDPHEVCVVSTGVSVAVSSVTD